MMQSSGILWDLAENKILVLTTNGTIKKDDACVMDRGIALEVAQRFPEIPYTLGRYIKQYGNRCFNLGNWGAYRIVSFPVKHHWRDAAGIELIKTSAEQITQMADKYGWEQVFIPRPGCGNGKLSWKEVGPVVASILDDRFIICTFAKTS
jgi:hypothetical protein